MSLFSTIRTAAAQRLSYQRTLRALSAVDAIQAVDLGIDRSEIRAIAHRSVYGY